MKFITLLTVTVLLILNSSFAQSHTDYYITVQHDTIYGDFSSSSDGKIKFRVDGKKVKLDPKSVYRVYDSNRDILYAPSYIQNCIVKIEGSNPKMYKISERLRKKEKPLFVQLLADGEIAVYSFVLTQTLTTGGSMMGGVTTQSSYRCYALKKSTNEIVELRKTGPVLFFQVSTTRINRNLSNFFDHSPELLAAIEKEPKVNYEFIIEIVKKYNEQKELKGEGTSYGTHIF